MAKLYPDISHWHPVINWPKVADACGLIISKATQGTGYIDPTLDSFIEGCEKHQIPYWLYTYLNKGNELAQTKFLVNVCKSRVGEFFQGYCLDIEANNPEANCMSALAWLKTQHKKTMIYTGWVDRSMYKNLIANRGDTIWWEARYGKNNGVYNPAYPCHDGVDLHQYTSVGNCPGVQGTADLNRFVNISENDMMNKPEPAPTPVPTPTTKKGYTGVFPAFETGRDCYKQGDGITAMKNYPTQIKRVQMVLKWITGEKLTIDGKYGSKTADACRKAQKILGATVDGIFGTQTLRLSKAYKK